MNPLKAFRNLPMIKKIFVLVAIPSVSYLILAFIELRTDYAAIRLGEIERVNNEAMRKVSNLIKEVQVERGRSAVFLKSNGSVSLDGVNAQRLQVNEKLTPTRNALGALTESIPEAKKALAQLDGLNLLRARVENREPVGEVVGNYTAIVKSLMSFQKATSIGATAEVSAMIHSFMLLEAARESAGLFRANVSGILAANTPITTSQLEKILRLKGRIDAKLTSEALELSKKSTAMVQSLSESEAWQTTNTVFKAVLANSNTGNYGFEAQTFFATITEVVNGIGAVVDSEIAHIEETIESEHAAAINRIMIMGGGILINLLLILFFSTYAIRNVRRTLNSVLGRLTDASNEISEASSSLSQSSQQLAAGSQETAAALQETVSSMSEMSSMVDRTNEKSKQTKESSKEVGERVESGNQIVDEMVLSMDSIKESNTQLEEINKIIGSISKHTKVINDIVFKTQLLAVNASIESAKAGSQGKGFAVVADEVSKLALMSGEASAKISGLLEESDEKVTSIVRDVGRRVDRGMDTTNKVKEVFSTIRSEISGIRSSSDDMSQASEEQSLGIEQVTSAVSEIDTATQTNTTEAQIVEKHAATLQKDSVLLKSVSEDLNRILFGGSNGNEATTTVELPPSTKSDNQDHIPAPSLSDEKIVSLADHDSFRPAAGD